MKMKSRGLAIVLVLALVLSLCGCEKQNNSVVQDLKSIEASGAIGDTEEETVNQLKERFHVPEKLELDVFDSVGGRWYHVDAKVNMPVAERLSVYEEEQIPFSREEIVKKAKRIFDSGKFSYVKPIDCYTLDELNEELLETEKKLNNKTEKNQRYYKMRKIDLELRKNEWEQAAATDYQKGDFSESVNLFPYSRIMIIEGEIDGESYHLLAFTSNGQNYIKLVKLNYGYSVSLMKNYFGYTWDGDVSLEQGMGGEANPEDLKRDYMYEENMCSYTEEEAQKLALQYAAQMGDTDMAIAYTNWYVAGMVTLDNGEEEEEIPEEDKDKEYERLDKNIRQGRANGYVFYLQRQIGTGICNDSNFWWREATEMGKERAAKVDPLGILTAQEGYRRVQVMDEGVVSIDTIGPWYEITKTLSDSTNLMDFSDVQELTKEYLEEVAKLTDLSSMNEMILRYATVLYDGKYTLVPCWFFNRTGDWDRKTTIMIINAIDGSMIYSCGFA